MRKKVGGELDYLQVFYLETTEKNNKRVLNIHHKQEIPSGNIDYIIPIEEEINCKVFVIDDIEVVTMLMVEEY